MTNIGKLKVQVFTEDKDKGLKPIEGAKVTIVGERKNAVIEQVTTDTSGVLEFSEIETPPIEYSMNPTGNRPYGLYDVVVEAEGYEGVIIQGCQIFPKVKAIQEVFLDKEENNRERARKKIIKIKDNVLVGNFPNKELEFSSMMESEYSLKKGNWPTEKNLYEDLVQEENDIGSGTTLEAFPHEVDPFIPEFIIVHDGYFENPAIKYTVKFKDYIKNVASCEIYPSWPSATLRANIMCIISFTLNRYYTEWYKGKKKSFHITSSTRTDHSYDHGRNIYEPISKVVDEIFSTYIKRFLRSEPLLAQYCDGDKMKCAKKGWLEQWKSMKMGSNGKNEIEILKSFYGNDIVIERAEEVRGMPSSYPGHSLKIGSVGSAVRNVQTYLNAISKNYPAIPKLNPDSKFGQKTTAVVKKFQEVFNLNKTGIVDYSTWYSISNIYVAVKGMTDVRNQFNRKNIFIPPHSHRNDNVPKIEYPCDY